MNRLEKGERKETERGKERAIGGGLESGRWNRDVVKN